MARHSIARHNRDYRRMAQPPQPASSGVVIAFGTLLLTPIEMVPGQRRALKLPQVPPCVGLPYRRQLGARVSTAVALPRSTSALQRGAALRCSVLQHVRVLQRAATRSCCNAVQRGATQVRAGRAELERRAVPGGDRAGGGRLPRLRLRVEDSPLPVPACTRQCSAVHGRASVSSQHGA